MSQRKQARFDRKHYMNTAHVGNGNASSDKCETGVISAKILEADLSRVKAIRLPLGGLELV